jgi:hypothetical protein
MISYRMPLGLTAFLLASAACGANSAYAAGCESLTTLKLPNTTITVAQSQAAGAFTPPGSPAGAKAVPVAFCRVTGSIKRSCGIHTLCADDSASCRWHRGRGYGRRT